MQFINQMFQNISMGIFMPLMLVLVIFFFVAIYRLVDLVLKQKKESKFWNVFKHSETNPARLKLLEASESPLAEVLNYLKDSELKNLNKQIDFNQAEVFYDQKKFASRSMIRLGPVFGLLGTLIPLGPALGGLANGDTQTMASNMQIAFATTVIGMIIGAIGFVINNTERQKTARDLSVLEWYLEGRFPNANEDGYEA